MTTAATITDTTTVFEFKPRAVIVDLDGTLAVRGERPPYYETNEAVLTDTLNRNVALLVDALHLAGYKIVYTSGRRERCRAGTEEWLARYFRFRPEGLYMRADGDTRDDAIVKRDMYETWIKPDLDVVLVLDDRDKVVAMWREIGLTCLQVAPGNF